MAGRRTVDHKKHKKFRYSPFSSFMHYPRKADFSNKDPEEEVILILRRHPITNIGWVLTTLLLLIAPFILMLLPFIEALPFNYQMILLLMWYMMTVAFVFEKFLSWYFNVVIITDERIFDVDFHHMISREITDVNIDQIQDVTVRFVGTIRTVFNYGDVIVQTAAEILQVEFGAIPHPDRVAKVLRQLRVEEEIEKLEGRVR